MSPLICMLLSASNRFGCNTDWFLIEMQRSGCSLTVLLPLSFCVCFVFFFIYPCLFLFPSLFLSLSISSCLLPLLCPLLSFFFFLFCMLLLSLAWNGDWKPPKVWRNCKSQKQPAQQPCKSTRNFLWKGREGEKGKKAVAESVGCVLFSCSAEMNALLLKLLLHCLTDTHN